MQESAHFSTLCGMVVSSFRKVLCWDGACVYLVDDEGTAFDHHLFGVPAEQLTLYHRALKHHDPLSPARFAGSTVNVVPLEVAQRDFDASFYVDTFLNAFNLQHEVELFFRNDTDRIVAGMALFRSAQSGRFRLSEIDLLDRVRPVAECGFNMLAMSRDGSSCPSSRHGLTPRETEVVELVRRGFSNRGIAGTLDISVATVKTHLFNSFEKVGVSSRTELLSRLFSHH